MALSERAYRPAVVIPPYVPPSTEEIARRKALEAEVDRLRESMPVVANNVADWVREDRERDSWGNNG